MGIQSHVYYTTQNLIRAKLLYLFAGYPVNLIPNILLQIHVCCITITPALNLAYLASPGQFFLGAKFLMGPPECKTNLSLKKLVWAM